MTRTRRLRRYRRLILAVLIALGTALVFAYMVTELQVRLFYGDQFALFVVACIALLLTYLLGYARASSTRRRRKARQPPAQQSETSH